MSQFDNSFWERLAAGPVRGELLWARRALPNVTNRLLGALDADGRRHLLVPLLDHEASIQDSHSRGLGVLTRELTMPEHGSGRYLDITCYDTAGHRAFDLIGEEFAQRLAGGHETAPEIVVRVLSRWRRFWGESQRPVLSLAEQLGLFAELWFLLVWLSPRAGIAEAVNRWRGPFAARHDFEWPGRSVEVKATTSTRGRIHRINGIDQLALPELGELFLFSLRVREEAGATNTLPSLVIACRARIQDNADVLGRFEQGLTVQGYSPLHDEEYARLHLRIVEEGLFKVEDNFPRITAEQLNAGLPSGVQSVDYEINLSGFEHLCVARQAGDLVDF